jgi:hypothetical protein
MVGSRLFANSHWLGTVGERTKGLQTKNVRQSWCRRVVGVDTKNVRCSVCFLGGGFLWRADAGHLVLVDKYGVARPEPLRAIVRHQFVAWLTLRTDTFLAIHTT